MKSDLHSADNYGIMKIQTRKQDDIERYIKAYREYCRPVKSSDDFRIAPFHILAVEGNLFSEEKHIRRMENIRRYITGIDTVYLYGNAVFLR